MGIGFSFSLSSKSSLYVFIGSSVGLFDGRPRRRLMPTIWLFLPVKDIDDPSFDISD